MDILNNCISWFCEVVGNICDTFYNFMGLTLADLGTFGSIISIIGIPNDTPFILILGGAFLIVLISWKFVQWLTTI
jgi:hypothetical protein